jgi:hypothetical protein
MAQLNFVAIGIYHPRSKVNSVWAERAKVAGYPERFAQLALGHSSKAVHRAYAKKAQVAIPLLEEFENKMVRLPSPAEPVADRSEQNACA